MLATKIAASTGVSSARYGRNAGLGNACPIVNRLPCYLPPCGGGRRRTAASGGGPASTVPLWPPSPTRGEGARELSVAREMLTERLHAYHAPSSLSASTNAAAITAHLSTM